MKASEVCKFAKNANFKTCVFQFVGCLCTVVAVRSWLLLYSCDTKRSKVLRISVRIVTL
jgi:hypothetical protein